MLKLTFWILLVANIVMFAATQTYTVSPQKLDESQQLQPVEPEKIRLLPSTLATSQTGSPNSVVSAKQENETNTCIEIGEFDTEGAKIFEEKIKNLLSDGSAKQVQTQNLLSYMVYLPAAKNRNAAEKRIKELQNKGINNYFLIANGAPFKNAISLGIFKNEEAAKNLVIELQKLGFSDVQTHVRTKPAGFVSFQILNADETHLQEVERFLADFPQVSKKSCKKPDNFAKEN